MNWGTTPVTKFIKIQMMGKLEFEAYLGMAQELSDSKESVLKQGGADSDCANIETLMLSSKQHGVSWFSFIVYVLYKSLCKIKSCQNFTPKRDESTFVSFKREFPGDE